MSTFTLAISCLSILWLCLSLGLEWKLTFSSPVEPGTWNVRSMNQGKLEVVKHEMARVNVDILGLSKLKWTEMGEFNLDDHYIYYFCFPVPYNEKDIFFGVLVLKGFVGLYSSVELQFLQHFWSGHRLGIPWYWMVYLGNEQRSFCHFWDCIQVLHFGLLCWPWCLLHFF